MYIYYIYIYYIYIIYIYILYNTIYFIQSKTKREDNLDSIWRPNKY